LADLPPQPVKAADMACLEIGFKPLLTLHLFE